MRKIYVVLLFIAMSDRVFAGQFPVVNDNELYFYSPLQDTTTTLNNPEVNYPQLKDSVLYSPFFRLLKQATDSFTLRLQEKVKSLQKQKLNYYISAENTAGFQNLTDDKIALVNKANIEGGINFMGVPLGFEYTNGYFNREGRQYHDNLFRVTFDKERLLKHPSSGLPQLKELKKSAKLPDVCEEIRSLIAAELSRASNLYDPEQAKQYKEVAGYISNPEHALELLELKEADLKNKLGKMIKKQAGPITKNNIQKRAVNDIRFSNEKLDSIVNRINGIKAELKKIGWNVQKIKTVEKYLTTNQHIALSDMTEIAGLVGKEGKGLAPVFSKIRTLKVGSFGNSIRSSMSNQDILMRGAHVSVFTGRGPVTVGYGKNEDLDLVKDAGMENSVYSSPQKLAYLSMGINNSNYLRGKFTWINSISSGQLNERLNVSSLPKNTVGLTINESLDLKKIGTLNFDLSKSAIIYRTALEPGAERILEHKNFFNDYLFDSSFQTLGFGISHQGEIQPWNISDNLYLNYSGLGYQNPVSAGISPVRFKVGGTVKKGFFNNKIALNLRTDLRHTPIGNVSGDRWKNFQFQFNGRFRISRKYSFSLKYLENGMVKQVNNINNSLYSSHKFQLDANANYKIWRYPASSHLNIAYQNLSNMQGQAEPGNFVNMNYSHSVVLGQNSLTANVFYNKELSPFQIIGDMVNGEVCYQYLFFEKLNMSTAVNYLENGKITRQYGVRQSFQLVAAKDFDFNASADIRKNVIEPLYPDLYPACQAELSLKYYLNK